MSSFHFDENKFLASSITKKIEMLGCYSKESTRKDREKIHCALCSMIDGVASSNRFQYTHCLSSEVRDKVLKISEHLSRKGWGYGIGSCSSRICVTILKLAIGSPEEEKEVALIGDCISTIIFNGDEFMLDDQTLVDACRIMIKGIEIDDELFVHRVIDALKDIA